MISYGDAIDYCINNNVSIRFVRQDARAELMPGARALELTVIADGRERGALVPLDPKGESSAEASRALPNCVAILRDSIGGK